MWEKFKNWCKGKVLPWLKTNWLSLATFVVLLIINASLPDDSGLNVFVSLWIFVIIGVLGWRLFMGKKPLDPIVPVAPIKNPEPVKPKVKTKV